MRTILSTLIFLALTFSAGAEGCVPDSSYPEVTIPAGLIGAARYIDNDLCQPECLFSIWSYEESNGIEGLQRNDESVDNTCNGMIEADTLSPY